MQRYLNSLASTATGLPLSGASVTVQYYPQGTGSITTPIASPGVVNWTAHGMIAGQPFVPEGTWPTGVTPGQVYYVLPTGLTADAFEMAATLDGTPIDFTVSAGSAQSINAPIYKTDSTVTLLANPLTTDINGAFGFYAPDGRYQLTIVPSGGGSSVLQDIELFDPSDSRGGSVRPTAAYLYQSFFDTVLGQPIWCTDIALPQVWVNSAGVVV